MKLIRSPNDQLLSIAPSRGCPTTSLKAWGWVTAQWILYFSNEQLRFNAFVHHLCAKAFFSARKEASQFEPGLWQSFLQRLVCRRPPPAEPTPRDSRWTCGALVRICSHSVLVGGLKNTASVSLRFSMPLELGDTWISKNMSVAVFSYAVKRCWLWGWLGAC